MPVTALVIGNFATITLLTKNSFLDEIGKQYVVTARAKGLTERRVLYGHVFRNAMLLVIAGLPAALLGIFFTGSLLIEVIFSLDGLGLLSFEAAMNRDYPVVFGTLFIFTLFGLVMKLISDIVYTLVDPRIDFENQGVIRCACLPINQRRWARFKSNKRGWWSLWLFLILFVGSLGAELIANDKPLVVHYDGGWYFPVFKRYRKPPSAANSPGSQLQEPLHQPTDRREGRLGALAADPLQLRHHQLRAEGSRPRPPSAENWLGTDDQARDVLARVIYGFRVSILFALTLTVLSSLIGVTVGALQGYYGGWVDLLGQRFLEVWSGLPVLYLLIILASFVQPNFWWLLGIMLLFSWMSLVDVVRAEFLRGRNLEYVRAARALGMRNSAIMFRHILPNAMISTLTFMPFILTGAIGTLTSLDFLGFGLPPGAPSLGELVAQGKSNLQAPWLGISAFVVLAVMLSLLVFIGEAARDAFDPRK